LTGHFFELRHHQDVGSQTPAPNPAGDDTTAQNAVRDRILEAYAMNEEAAVAATA